MIIDVVKRHVEIADAGGLGVGGADEVAFVVRHLVVDDVLHALARDALGGVDTIAQTLVESVGDPAVGDLPLIKFLQVTDLPRHRPFSVAAEPAPRIRN